MHLCAGSASAQTAELRPRLVTWPICGKVLRLKSRSGERRMVDRCRSLTKAGKRCQIELKPHELEGGLCHVHNPEGTYQRQRRGRKARCAICGEKPASVSVYGRPAVCSSACASAQLLAELCEDVVQLRRVMIGGLKVPGWCEGCGEEEDGGGCSCPPQRRRKD